MRFDHKHNYIPCSVGNFLFASPTRHVNELGGLSKKVTVSPTVSKVARDSSSHWQRDWKYMELCSEPFYAFIAWCLVRRTNTLDL
jgi:hypothetical protein